MKWPKKVTSALSEPDAIEMYGIGKFGIIQDVKPHLLVPEAYTSGRNVRFGKNGLQRFKGDLEIFEPLDIEPQMILSVPSSGQTFWLYPSLNKLYCYDGTDQANVTRQTGMSDVNYNATEGWEWQATIIGGIPIFNNGVDAPQYWPAFNPTTRFANLTGWPSGVTAKIVKSFGPFLIAFNIQDNGDNLPKAIRWSSQADPGTIPLSWDYTDPEVDAGQLQLTDDKGGEILDALLLGNKAIIYTENATHVARYVGGIDIFATDLLLKTSGILATHCVTAFNKGRGHVVVTDNDVIMHTGTMEVESIVENRNKEYLFRSLDPDNYKYSFIFENAPENEVWFCYPTIGSEFPNLALVWNYKFNTQTFRDIDFNRVDTGSIFNDSVSLVWADAEISWENIDIPWNNESRNKVVAVSRNQSLAYAIDQGDLFAGTSYPSYVERLGLSIDGKDSEGKPKSSIQSIKQMKRLWPKVTGTEPVIVRAASQAYPDGPVTFSDPQTFIPGVDKWLDVMVVGQLIGYRIEHNGTNIWQCEGVDFQIVEIAKL